GVLAILEEVQPLRHAEDGFVFPGGKPGRPLSNMAFLMLLRRMERDDLTAHGFRSSFRDWCAERTSYPSELAEMALAHTVSDKTVAAYNRSDLFDKRRRLMAAWAQFLIKRPSGEGKVLALRGGGSPAKAGAAPALRRDL